MDYKYSINNIVQFTHRINFSQCNIFSLGMLLLRICTLSDPVDLFYHNFSIDYFEVNAVMASDLEKRYSGNLLMLIGKMIHPNPHERIRFETVR